MVCMTYTHTTLLRNLPSIKRYGILLSYCRGKRKAVWVHGPRLDAWAECHISINHDAEGEPLVHLTLDLKGVPVYAHGKGLYYVQEDIEPSRIKQIRIIRRQVEVIDL